MGCVGDSQSTAHGFVTTAAIHDITVHFNDARHNRAAEMREGTDQW